MNVATSPRIGYVVPEFPQASDPQIVEELLALERSGIDLTIFALRRPDTSRHPAKAARLQARVAYLPARAPIRERAQWIAGQLQGIEHLHAHSALQSAEVTHEISELNGIPYSFSVTATDLARVRQRDLRARAELAQFIVARSARTVEQIADICDAAVLHKCHRVYHGIDPAEFPFFDNLRPAAALLGVAGPHGHDGVGSLLTAIAAIRPRVPSAQLTIVAPESMHAALRVEIARRKLGGAVPVIATANEAALSALMRMHTLLVMPWATTRAPAGVPRILLEAMALGLPVVASDLPGVNEAIEDGWTGRLVPVGDTTWLAGAMETLLTGARLRHRMARRARQRLERDFSLPRNVSVLARLLAHAAAQRRWTPSLGRPARAAASGKTKGTGLWAG